MNAFKEKASPFQYINIVDFIFLKIDAYVVLYIIGSLCGYVTSVGSGWLTIILLIFCIPISMFTYTSKGKQYGELSPKGFKEIIGFLLAVGMVTIGFYSTELIGIVLSIIAGVFILTITELINLGRKPKKISAPLIKAYRYNLTTWIVSLSSFMIISILSLIDDQIINKEIGRLTVFSILTNEHANPTDFVFSFIDNRYITYIKYTSLTFAIVLLPFTFLSIERFFRNKKTSWEQIVPSSIVFGLYWSFCGMPLFAIPPIIAFGIYLGYRYKQAFEKNHLFLKLSANKSYRIALNETWSIHVQTTLLFILSDLILTVSSR